MSIDYRPFRGMRFQGAAGQGLAALTAPAWRGLQAPAEEARNILHLASPTGSAGHQAARRTMKRWREQGLLQLDEEPAFYLYQQEWTWGSERLLRSLWLGALAPIPFGEAVSSCQQADTGPVEDRFGLLQATRSHFEPALFLYSEPLLASDLARAVAQRPPLLDFQDSAGLEHRIFAVSDPEEADCVRSAASDLRLVLTEGQVAYQAALKQNDGDAGRKAWILAALESSQDQGVLALPVHRGLRGLAAEAIQRLPEQLDDFFRLERWTRSLPELLGHLTSQGRLGLGLGRALYFLEARAGAGRPAPLLVQELVFGELLGLDRDRLISGGLVEYDRDPYELDAGLDRGDLQAAFYLPPPCLEDLMDLGRQGGRLPPRSTVFHPELRAGLVILTHEGEPSE